MNMYRLLLIIVLSYSCQVEANAPINCSSDDPKLSVYYGKVSHMEFKEHVDFKEIARKALIEHARMIERIASWNRDYSGPDKEYIPILIDLLGESAGMKEEVNCLWSLYKEGDTVLKFKDNGHSVFRDGYAVFRNNIMVAYFYSSIRVV